MTQEQNYSPTPKMVEEKPLDRGYKLLRLLSILFLPEKYSYRQSYFCIEQIPIGWIMIIISLIIKYL